MYEGESYIGKVINIDNEDNEVFITFMEQASKQLNTYKWPRKADEILVERHSILYILQENPVSTGKSHRMFKLSATDE